MPGTDAVGCWNRRSLKPNAQRLKREARAQSLIGLSRAIQRWKDIWARFSGRGTYPHELAPLLLIPLRNAVLSPSQLVAQLQLTESSRVLEVGPGPGFFSVAVARAVPRGRLELVDIQAEMLARARRRLHDAGIRHAAFTQASADRLPFADTVFDVAFLVAVLGEVPDAAACLASIARVLKVGGRLVIAELPGDPDGLSSAELRELAKGTSLAFVSSRRVARATLTTMERSAGVVGSEDPTPRPNRVPKPHARS